MKLTQVHIEPSPDANGRVRLIGEVSYDNGELQPEQYWFEFPQEYEPYLSASGNPWLVCLLPLAVTMNEFLTISRPVCPELLNNIVSVMKVWKEWYPFYPEVSVNAEVFNENPGKTPGRSAAFFSGGVDSYFTVMRHEAAEEKSTSGIDDLITVWGFDIPLDNRDEFSRLRSTCRQSADELGKNLIDVTTNIRQTHWQRADWGGLSHGAALAAVGLCLEGRFKRVLIASTCAEGARDPWGSHFRIDPLYSTGMTRIIHDGKETSRIQKTEFISKSQTVRKSLHVCWKFGSSDNCSNCVKCYRTMLMLDLLGELRSFPAFDLSRYSPRKAAKIFMRKDFDKIYMNEIRAYALEHGRPEIAGAVDKSFKRSARLRKYIAAIRRLRGICVNKPLIWRIPSFLEKCLLKGSIE